MPELVARLRTNLAESRKARNKPLTLLLGTILADIQNRGIELGRDPTDDEVADVIRKGIKKRREALEIFSTAGRADLADKERSEVMWLEQYLPAQAGDDEIRAAVKDAIAAGASALGAVMGQVVPRFRGRADGARINAIAREELAART
jgi:uncharacterized protein YqeY